MLKKPSFHYKNKASYFKGAKDKLYRSNDCMAYIFEFLTPWKVLKFQQLSWRFYHRIVPRRLSEESVNINKNE
jgi:hypothetical protein